MKKLGLLMAGFVAAIIVIGNLGAMAVFAFCLAGCYYSAKQYLKSDTSKQKIFWAIVTIIFLSAGVSNVPALIGLIAVALLYFLYKKWNSDETEGKSDDPFTSFEREWNQINKNY